MVTEVNEGLVSTYYGDTDIAHKYDFGVNATSKGTSGIETTNPDSKSVNGNINAGAPTLEAPSTNGNISLSDLTLMITEMRNNEAKGSLKEMVQSIKHHVNSKQKQNNDRYAALKKSWDKMAKAHKAGIFGKIFHFISKYIAPALMLVAGAALVATGAGTALGAFLMTAAVVNMVMSNDKVQEGLEKALGSKGLMALNISIAAVELLGAIALTVMTGGAAAPAAAAEATEIGAVTTEVTAEGVEAGTTALEIGTEAAEIGTEGFEIGTQTATEAGEIAEVSQGSLAETSTAAELGETGEIGEAAEASEAVDKAEKAKKVARIMNQTTQVVNDANAVAKDADDIVVADFENQAQHAENDVKRALAEIAREAALQAQDDKVLKDLIDNIEQIFASCSQLLSSQSDAKLELSRELGQFASMG